MRRTSASAVMILSLALALAACGSSAKSSTPTTTVGSPPSSTATASTTPTIPTAPKGGPAIVIEVGGSGFKFTTSPVKAGSTVTVKNNTSVQHTVTADTVAGGFDVTVDPGTTTTFTAPTTPGAYKFHCNIHTYMMGTLNVT